MRIEFSPMLTEGTLALHRAGDVLTVNGTTFDFTSLPEGGRLPRAAVPCPWLADDVRRIDGKVRVVLILPLADDAAVEVRFPAPLDPATAGVLAAPGLVAPVPPYAPGMIDWNALVTAEAESAAVLAAWRDNREISKLDLVLAMAGAGILAPASAITAAGGGIPPEFEPVIAAMPEPGQTEARIRWAGAATIPRMSPTILAVQQAAGLPDQVVDALFGWGN
jgi:hypothetical protein